MLGSYGVVVFVCREVDLCAEPVMVVDARKKCFDTDFVCCTRVYVRTHLQVTQEHKGIIDMQEQFTSNAPSGECAVRYVLRTVDECWREQVKAGSSS